MAKKKTEKVADGIDGILHETETVAELWDYTQAAVEAGCRPIIYGPPGVGKTKGLEARARAAWKKGTFETLLGALSEPEDVNGHPVEGEMVTDARGRKLPTTVFAPRDIFLRLNEHGGVLFMDEINNSGVRTLKALLRSLNDGVFGDYALDMDRVGIIAAANPPDVGVDADDLPPPSANRLVHMSWPTGPIASKEWCHDYASYWGNPPKVTFFGKVLPEDVFARCRAMVCGFLSTRHEHWLKVPDDRVKAGLAWPSPRSWDAATRMLARAVADGRRPEWALRLIEGSVGPGVAVEFATYLRECEIPDPEEMLRNPKGYRNSPRPDVAYAALSSCVVAVQQKFTEERFLALAEIVGQRVAKEAGAAEVAAGAFNDLVIMKKKYYKEAGLSAAGHQRFSVLTAPLDAIAEVIKKG